LALVRLRSDELLKRDVVSQECLDFESSARLVQDTEEALRRLGWLAWERKVLEMILLRKFSSRKA
jgi:hypothetical protein